MRFSPFAIFTVIYSIRSSHVHAKTKIVPLTAEYFKVTTNPASEVPNRIIFNPDETVDLKFINGMAMYPEKWTKLLGVSDLNSGEWTYQMDIKITGGNFSDNRFSLYLLFNKQLQNWPGDYGDAGVRSHIISLYHGDIELPNFTITKCGQTTARCNLHSQGNPALSALNNGDITSYRVQRLLTGHVKFTYLTGSSSATEGDTVWVEATTDNPVTWNALSNTSNNVPISLYTQYSDHKVTQIRISDESSVGAGGDPHFMGFGGIHYSWQGVCDLILLKTPKLSPTNPEISIHIRTGKVRNWSAIHDVAMKVDNNIIEIGSIDGKLILNGNEVNSVKHDTVSVLKSFPKSKKRIFVYDVDFRNSKKLEIRVNTRSHMINTKVSGNYPTNTAGLLGSAHSSGLISRNGTTMTKQEVNEFAESWQVNDSDPDLFQKSREPKFPSHCQYFESDSKFTAGKRRLKEIQNLKLSDAKAACAAHPPGYKQDFCIDDVLATSDIEIAEDPFYG